MDCRRRSIWTTSTTLDIRSRVPRSRRATWRRRLSRPNVAIADAIGISARTVESHLLRVMKKVRDANRKCSLILCASYFTAYLSDVQIGMRRSRPRCHSQSNSGNDTVASPA
ncbi:LuxR C-terminal-related transcriptional regulator [Leifsonia aquatica]